MGRSLRSLGRVVLGHRPRQQPWDLSTLLARGLSPNTLIDVGCAYGTPGLYRLYPHAFLALVDPLPGEWAAKISERLARHNRRGEYVEVALGASEGRGHLRVEQDRARSSLLDRSALTAGDSKPELKEIRVTSLDRLVTERGWKGPFGIKIDTEGYELQVLAGAEITLASTQFVIAEVSVAKRFEGSYEFAELISYLSDRGFRLLDILEQHRRPEGLSYLDCAFVTEGAVPAA